MLTSNEVPGASSNISDVTVRTSEVIFNDIDMVFVWLLLTRKSYCARECK